MALTTKMIREELAETSFTYSNEQVHVVFALGAANLALRRLLLLQQSAKGADTPHILIEIEDLRNELGLG